MEVEPLQNLLSKLNGLLIFLYFCEVNENMDYFRFLKMVSGDYNFNFSDVGGHCRIS